MRSQENNEIDQESDSKERQPDQARKEGYRSAVHQRENRPSDQEWTAQ